MKKILICVSMLMLAACRTPQPHPRLTSVAALKESYAGYPRLLTEDINLSLWVNSSDRYGNFYGSLTAQDATGGIEIKIDSPELFRYFPQRARIDIRCQGLWLGASGGGICLGTRPTSGYSVDRIPEQLVPAHITVSDENAVTAPAAAATIGALDASMIFTLVGLSDVQFIEEEILSTWGCAGQNTVRHIIDRAGDTLDVYISSLAGFADKRLPSGSGYIEGTLNCYSGRYSLRPSWDRSAEMEGERF